MVLLLMQLLPLLDSGMLAEYIHVMVLNGKKQEEIFTELRGLLQPKKIADKFISSFSSQTPSQDVEMSMEDDAPKGIHEVGHVALSNSFEAPEQPKVRGSVKLPRALIEAVDVSNSRPSRVPSRRHRASDHEPKSAASPVSAATTSDRIIISRAQSKREPRTRLKGRHLESSGQRNGRASEDRKSSRNGEPLKKRLSEKIVIDPSIHLFKSKKFGHLSQAELLGTSPVERNHSANPATHGGNKSLILNPECLAQIPCRFGVRCLSRPSCPYMHVEMPAGAASEAASQAGTNLADTAVSYNAALLCKYHPWCSKYPDCPYMHPKPASCRYNEGCYRNDCIFSHPASGSNGCPVAFNCLRPYCKQHHPKNFELFCASGSPSTSQALQNASPNDAAMLVEQRDLANSSPLIRI